MPAVRPAAAWKPDLITLDLQLPGEWGPRFYRKLRKDKELKDIPVIVVSGIDGDHAIKGAVAFVKKPFDPEKLIGIVKNTIG
jgi:CheY-like chemotaxis protein